MRIPRLGVEEPVHEPILRRKVVLRQHRPGPPRRQHHLSVCACGWGVCRGAGVSVSTAPARPVVSITRVCVWDGGRGV